MFIVFFSTQHPKTLLFEENLPLCESVRDRTFYPLQTPREDKYSLVHSMVAKVLVHELSLDQSDAPARDWNSEWCKDDTVYNSGRAEAVTSSDGSSGSRQNCPVPAASLTRFFSVLTLAVVPNDPSLLVSAYKTSSTSFWKGPGLFAINTFMLRWVRLFLLLANKNLD